MPHICWDRFLGGRVTLLLQRIGWSSSTSIISADTVSSTYICSGRVSNVSGGCWSVHVGDHCPGTSGSVRLSMVSNIPGGSSGIEWQGVSTTGFILRRNLQLRRVTRLLPSMRTLYCQLPRVSTSLPVFAHQRGCGPTWFWTCTISPIFSSWSGWHFRLYSLPFRILSTIAVSLWRLISLQRLWIRYQSWSTGFAPLSRDCRASSSETYVGLVPGCCDESVGT